MRKIKKRSQIIIEWTFFIANYFQVIASQRFINYVRVLSNQKILVNHLSCYVVNIISYRTRVIAGIKNDIYLKGYFSIDTLSLYRSATLLRKLSPWKFLQRICQLKFLASLYIVSDLVTSEDRYKNRHIL